MFLLLTTTTKNYMTLTMNFSLLNSTLLCICFDLDFNNLPCAVFGPKPYQKYLLPKNMFSCGYNIIFKKLKNNLNKCFWNIIKIAFLTFHVKNKIDLNILSSYCIFYNSSWFSGAYSLFRERGRGGGNKGKRILGENTHPLQQ